MMKEKTIYALGYFDGVHAGHKALLAACRQLAQAHNCLAGAVTFTGHPETLLLGKTPRLINTDDDRNKLLTRRFSVICVELAFDARLMATPWQTFLQMLVKDYGAAGFVCGSDFRFGSAGEGNADRLAAWCAQQSLCCQIVPPQELDGVRISSTHIRGLLENGEMANAVRFLGHPHILSGVVMPGKQLGRTIGVPTANLFYPQQLVKLPYGVYACRVKAGDRCFRALTNVGVRPTVAGQGVTVESWLQDFSGDLYGQEITVAFYEFIRPEQKFADLLQLKSQIEEDRCAMEKALAQYPVDF